MRFGTLLDIHASHQKSLGEARFCFRFLTERRRDTRGGGEALRLESGGPPPPLPKCIVWKPAPFISLAPIFEERGGGRLFKPPFFYFFFLLTLKSRSSTTRANAAQNYTHGFNTLSRGSHPALARRKKEDFFLKMEGGGGGEKTRKCTATHTHATHTRGKERTVTSISLLPSFFRPFL